MGGRKGGEGRGQQWKRDCLFFVFFFPPVPAGGKCLSKSSVTIAEVKVTQIKNSLYFKWEVSWGLQESGRVRRECNYLPRLEQALLHDLFSAVVFVGPQPSKKG